MRVLALFLFWGVSSALLTSQYALRKSEKAPCEPFVKWAKKHAIPVSTVESGKDFRDLYALKRSIGEARVVLLGESGHGMHEFRAFRNRLFEFLVKEMGFTAIATETGVTEGTEVDDYVAGDAVNSDKAARGVFSWDSEAEGESRELIEWIRHYNGAVSTSRKVRFYGIDLTGGRNGEFTESRLAIDASLAYLKKVAPDLEHSVRPRLEPLLPRFVENSYSSLTPSDRDELSAAIAELASLFRSRRLDFLARGSKRDYEAAYRNAIVAEQIDAFFRTELYGNQKDYRNKAAARDSAMADNVHWVLDHERPLGRVLVFAHDGHVLQSRFLKVPYPESFPTQAPPPMGTYLRSIIPDPIVVLGFTFGEGDEVLKVPNLEAASIDGLLAGVGLPLFALDLRTAPTRGPAADCLHTERSMRMNDRYAVLSPLDSFDVLVFVKRVTPLRPSH